MIRVMVVDDSAFMRRLLVKILESHDDIEVVETAMDGKYALDKIEKLADRRPDVVTLDLDMPRLNGMSTLRRLVDKYSLPVVLVSAHTSAGAQATFEGLASGAVDFVTKPERVFSTPVDSLGADLVAKVRIAAKARPPARSLQASSDASAAHTRAVQMAGTGHDVIGIAVSTGGPHALSLLLSELAEDFRPALLIVQHMPEGFTAQFADRLTKLTSFEVREATDGELVRGPVGLIAPGGQHMELVRDDDRAFVRLSRERSVKGHRPSADVMFRSIADVRRDRAVGVVMTGMGEDGADGLGAIRAAGGHTLAQDESSSVVYGMPRAAIERGVVDHVLPLNQMASYLNLLSSQGPARGRSRGGKSQWTT